MSNQSHYSPNVPGQYTPPFPEGGRPPIPPKRKMPLWAKLVIIFVGAPMILVGAVGAIVAGTAASEIGKPLVSPSAPVDTYDPGIQTPPTKAAPRTHEAAPAVPDVPTDGTLIVGKNVKPGLYQTRVLDDEMPLCSWKRLSSLDGDLDSTIDLDLSTTAGALVTLRIKPSDYAVEINCWGAVWTRVGA